MSGGFLTKYRFSYGVGEQLREEELKNNLILSLGEKHKELLPLIMNKVHSIVRELDDLEDKIQALDYFIEGDIGVEGLIKGMKISYSFTEAAEES